MTASLLRWPKHRMVGYESLGGCAICGGWEGEMPTDCPGLEMTEEQRRAVLAGKLDFIWREGWTTVTRMDRLRVRIFCEEGRWI